MLPYLCNKHFNKDAFSFKSCRDLNPPVAIFNNIVKRWYAVFYWIFLQVLSHLKRKHRVPWPQYFISPNNVCRPHKIQQSWGLRHKSLSQWYSEVNTQPFLTGCSWNSKTFKTPEDQLCNLVPHCDCWWLLCIALHIF